MAKQRMSKQMEQWSWLWLSSLAALVLCSPLLCLGQPHPFPMGFTISATSKCSANESGQLEFTTCQLRNFNVCMELQYYPEVCRSRVLTTHTMGNCSQQGKYVNATYATLTPGNDELPQNMWVVNFNSTNPLLPMLPKGGLHCEYEVCSVIVKTPPDDEHGFGDVPTCETNITVQAYGWYSEDAGNFFPCDEEPALDRCQP